MYKKIIVMTAMIMGLTSCNDYAVPIREPDQGKRHEYFMACLAAAPKGPIVTGDDNPWDDVIDSCETAAYYQSLTCVANCRTNQYKEEEN